MGWVGLGNLIENEDTYEIPKTLKTKKKNDDEPAALNKFDDEVFFDEETVARGNGILGTNRLVSLSDARSGVIEKVINDISKKLIGKELKSDDNEKLKELADLLVMELEIAAARTKTISNVPAFLTEHLRRRLLGKSNVQTSNKTSGAKSARQISVDW